MSVVYISSSKVKAIADAIREKTETTDGLTLDDMPKAIEGIKGGSDPSELALTIINKQVAECVAEDVTTIPDYAFYKFTGLKKLRIPNVVTVGTSAFDSCANIDQIDLPKCTKINNRSFASCGSATIVSLPLITDLPQGGLYGVGVKTVSIPLVKTLGSQGLRYSKQLERLDFLQLSSITALSLDNTNLSVLIVRTGSVCSLANTNAFTNTPIAKGTGYVYVPRNLVDSYKSATNWSSYANQIRAIEDYPEITGG